MMNLMINYHNQWWYKAITWILIFAIVLLISIRSAPPVKAIGILTATMAAAILAVLAGAGIYTVVTGMTSADIQTWLNNKLNQWDTYRNDGNVFSDLIQNNLITTTIKGALAIGNSAARGISDFISWLKNDLSLNDNNSYNVYSSGNIRDIFSYNTSGSGYLSFGSNYIDIHPTQAWNYTVDLIPVANRIEFDFLVTGYQNNLGEISLFQLPWGGTINLTNAINCSLSGTSILISSSGSFSSSGHIVYDNVTKFRNYFANSNNQCIIYFNNISINNVDYNFGSLSLDTEVINIPDVENDGQTDIIIGVDGVFPGATTEEAADVILNDVVDNTLDTTMTVTDEYVDAVEAVVINEQPISVNTDHHMIGFTNLPDFAHLNLNSIWHYVSDAVDYASDFITWFVSLLTSIPTLAIPLYMSFTLLIVLSFIRRILL